VVYAIHHCLHGSQRAKESFFMTWLKGEYHQRVGCNCGMPQLCDAWPVRRPVPGWTYVWCKQRTSHSWQTMQVF
jgi:hypothetical protein